MKSCRCYLSNIGAQKDFKRESYMITFAFENDDCDCTVKIGLEVGRIRGRATSHRYDLMFSKKRNGSHYVGNSYVSLFVTTHCYLG